MPERIHLNVNVNSFDHFKRDLAGNLLRLTDIEVTGHENLLKGACILNPFPHTSHLDSWTMRLALPPYLKHQLVFLAKKEYWDGWKHPFGELTNALILIPTAEGTFPLAAFRTAAACLSQGYSIGISAEGTRTLGIPIEDRKFEDGIGSLLSMTDYKYPLVPVLLKGFGRVWPKGQIPMTLERGGILFRRKPVYVHFGTPKFYQKDDFDNKDNRKTWRKDLVENFRQHCIREYHERFGASE